MELNEALDIIREAEASNGNTYKNDVEMVLEVSNTTSTEDLIAEYGSRPSEWPKEALAIWFIEGKMRSNMMWK